MQRFSDEVKEFFVPTARCFKGFSILLLIWGCASLLICGLVPTIIKVHNPVPVTSEEIVTYDDYNSKLSKTLHRLLGDEPVDPAVIMDRRDKADLLRYITAGIGGAFLVISFINFIMFKRFQNKEDQDEAVAADVRVREVEYRS